MFIFIFTFAYIQVCLDWRGWVTLKLEEMEFIERAYCNPVNDTVVTQVCTLYFS